MKLVFGALTHSISRQLADQGACLSPDVIASCQRDADAITRLAVRGLLPPQQVSAARKKLLRIIVKATIGSKG